MYVTKETQWQQRIFFACLLRHYEGNVWSFEFAETTREKQSLLSPYCRRWNEHAASSLQQFDELLYPPISALMNYMDVEEQN